MASIERSTRRLWVARDSARQGLLPIRRLLSARGDGSREKSVTEPVPGRQGGAAQGARDVRFDVERSCGESAAVDRGGNGRLQRLGAPLSFIDGPGRRAADDREKRRQLSASSGPLHRNSPCRLERRAQAAAGAGAPRPTLRMASKKIRGRPRSELTKISVTLTAMAAIAQIG